MLLMMLIMEKQYLKQQIIASVLIVSIVLSGRTSSNLSTTEENLNEFGQPKKVMTRKDKNVIEQRTKYYTKKRDRYTKDINASDSLCGGYQGCTNLVMCEICWAINENMDYGA